MTKSVHKDVQVIIDELEGRGIEVTPLLRSALMEISRKLTDKGNKNKDDFSKAMQDYGITKIEPGHPKFSEICRKFEALQRARLNLNACDELDKKHRTVTSLVKLMTAQVELNDIEREWEELSDRFKDDKPSGRGGIGGDNWEQRDFDLYNRPAGGGGKLKEWDRHCNHCGKMHTENQVKTGAAAMMPKPPRPRNEQIKGCWLCRLFK